MRVQLIKRLGLALVVLLPLTACLPALAALSKSEVATPWGTKITIVLDDYGVPHVSAATLRDAFFGNGYAVAQDRLVQLAKYRLSGWGRLAEVTGPSAVSEDKETRLLLPPREQMEQEIASLPPELSTGVRAYADGINAYVAEAQSAATLPSEFEAFKEGWTPWEPLDTVAVGTMMARRFGGEGGEELRNVRLLQALKERFGDQAMSVFNDFLWLNDPASPTTIPAAESPARPQAAAQHSAPPDLALRADGALLDRVYAEYFGPEVRARRAALGVPDKMGSYAWVVAPSRSAGGNPLLLGGPQMGFSVPQIAHEIHLMAPGLNVIGMGFAGVPGVLIGHNDCLAWTTTSAIGDAIDTFAEQTDPQNPHRYLYRGEWRDMTLRLETIKVKGTDPVTLEIYSTVHGPVMEWDTKNNIAYCWQATFGGKEFGTLEAITGFNRARNLSEFAALAAKITTSHNFFCATVDGDIGFWYCGRYPRRAPGFDYRFPVPGTGEADWRGLVAFDEQPQIINPKQGFLASWNNKPAVWWDCSDTPVWGAVQHVQEIISRLERDPLVTFEDMRRIAMEIGLNDVNVAAFLPPLLRAAENTGADSDPDLHFALQQLRSWNWLADDGSVPKRIFDTWLSSLRTEIFAEEMGDALNQFPVSYLVQPSAVLHALLGKESSVPLSRDYLNGRTKDEVTIAALRKALEQLASQDPVRAHWTYKQGAIDLVPLPPIPRTNRGTYIQIVELAKPELRSVNICPPGQSEAPNSPHYGDQRELAALFAFKPMLYLPSQLGLTP